MTKIKWLRRGIVFIILAVMAIMAIGASGCGDYVAHEPDSPTLGESSGSGSDTGSGSNAGSGSDTGSSSDTGSGSNAGSGSDTGSGSNAGSSTDTGDSYALGANFTFSFAGGEGSGYSTDAYTWEFNYSQPDVVVDFPFTQNVNGTSFDQYYVFILYDTLNTDTSFKWEKVYSDTATGVEETSFTSWGVAITQEYYDVLESLGYELTCEPETYGIGYYYGATYKAYTIGALLTGNWTDPAWPGSHLGSDKYAPSYPETYADYLELVSAIAALGETPLFRIRYFYVSVVDGTVDWEGTYQIYNISFSASSLAAALS